MVMGSDVLHICIQNVTQRGGGGGGRAQDHVAILLRLYEDHGAALPKHKVSCSEKSGPVASSAYMEEPKAGPTTEHEIR